MDDIVHDDYRRSVVVAVLALVCFVLRLRLHQSLTSIVAFGLDTPSPVVSFVSLAASVLFITSAFPLSRVLLSDCGAPSGLSLIEPLWPAFGTACSHGSEVVPMLFPLED